MLEEEATHYDRVTAAAHQKLYHLLKDIPELLPGRKVVAAFIIQRGLSLPYILMNHRSSR